MRGRANIYRRVITLRQMFKSILPYESGRGNIGEKEMAIIVTRNMRVYHSPRRLALFPRVLGTFPRLTADMARFAFRSRPLYRFEIITRGQLEKKEDRDNARPRRRSLRAT